jgi:hypothetical protein
MNENNSTVNLCELVQNIQIPAEQWEQFAAIAKARKVDLSEYLSVALGQEIDNALAEPDMIG